LRAHRAEQNLVTVGISQRNALGAVHAARAADIFDDHLLAENVAQSIRDNAATTSVGTPAANGTTMVMGRVGHWSACATFIAPSATAASTPPNTASKPATTMIFHLVSISPSSRTGARAAARDAATRPCH
jgi:hypothetical protein